MAVDEQSSQDSTLIDDDLVAALGFEPVTTVETSNGDVDETVLDDGAIDGMTIDDVVIDDDVPVDVVVDDVEVTPVDHLSTNGDHDGFGIDEIGDVDEMVDAIEVDDAVEDLTADVSEDLSVDEFTVDEVSVDDVDTDDVSAIADLDLDDVVSHDAEADVRLEAETDLDAVASISDDDLDVDATAPVDLVDLDLDDLDTADVPDLDESEVSDGDVMNGDVIDLDTVDLSESSVDEVAPDDVAAEELSTEGFVDAEIHELADADSVFADATPIVDPPGFDEPLGLPATETVGQVGLLDLDAGEASVSTEAAATTTAATATATKGRRRLRARKSRRVIRHIDPWSVLTFSVLFHMVVFAALLLSSVLVWNAAIASGMVENVESFIQELGDYETFEINADVMFRAAIVIAGMLTLASSVLVVLLTVVFNLISDLVGGIRVTVIEEETVRVPIDKKRSKARNE